MSTPTSTVIESHGFTNATLGWKAWLDVVDVASASPEQNPRAAAEGQP